MSNKKLINQISNPNFLVEGWQFSCIEISPNHYEIKGYDMRGHSVSRSCLEMEIEKTIERCADDAREIQKQIQEK